MSRGANDATILNRQAIDTGANATVYTQKWSMRTGSIFSCHMTWTGGASITVTLWQSNKENPDLTTDDDWVENTTLTLPAADVSGKAFVNAGNAAARWYRFKVVTGVGSGEATFYLFSSKGA